MAVAAPPLMKATPIADAIESLCPKCGLCCNGVLFADGELQRSDRTAWLEQLGLAIFRQGGKRRFAQPCACFDGRRCSIYANRPANCAAFECGVLQRLVAGKLSAAAARKTIGLARRKFQTLELHLQKSPGDDPALPLSHRYGAAMRAPVDLAQPGGAGPHGRLLRSMETLMVLLQTEFLR